MGMRFPGKLMLFVIVLFMIAWPVYQISGLINSKKQAGDATKLLYQVSLFQMELLNSFSSQAQNAARTDQLNGLKQAIYSANYTHQRLILAVGESKLAPLNSIDELLQYVMRLQIGGDRPIQPNEAKVFQNTAAQIAKIYEIYGNLMSSGRGVYSSQNDKLKDADKDLYAELKNALLQ